MITPIEMYTMVPKSQEASNVRHGEMAKDAGFQQGLVQHMEKSSNENASRTVKLKESDDPEYRYDNKDGGNGKGYEPGKGGKKKDQQAQKPSMQGYMGPGGIDIRI